MWETTGRRAAANGDAVTKSELTGGGKLSRLLFNVSRWVSTHMRYDAYNDNDHVLFETAHTEM